MSFLAPLFFVGLAAIAVPIFVHLIQRERKTVIEFPSLMFLRKIPYQSVERRRIHNWPLLLLRAAAMALVVAGFSRPFLEQDAVQAAPQAGAREVVILLDRSASMGYGNHWSRAQEEARKIVRGLSGEDRGALVLFDQNVEETVRATANRGELEVAIGQAAVSSGATRYAPALREAQSLLSRSDRGRREAYVISDFQKAGWERQEEIHLPEGAVITPISIADLDTSNVDVSSVAIDRAAFSGEERVTITAAVTNRGGTAVQVLPVKLEIDGRVIGTREVSVGPNTSGSVTFDALTVADANMQGVIRAGSDALAVDNNFYFVLSPSRAVSVLVIQSDGAPAATSLYLGTVLRLSKTPPFKTEVVPMARVSSASFNGRSVVVLNNTTSLPTGVASEVASFVERGGGLFVVLGDHSPAARDWALLPGTLGSPVDRPTARGGSLGYLDYSHPIFDEFKDPRNGNFANMRFYRYRGLAVGPNDKTLARFDDGSTAIAQRNVGAGRVIAFTSPVDNSWNDAPVHAMFLPLVHETIRYLAQYEQPTAWEAVGRMFGLQAAVASMVREGQVASTALAGGGGSGVVVAPSGKQVTLGQGGAPSLELNEQGIYSVRLAGSGDRKPFAVAVNLEPRESDLSALSPTDFLASVTGGRDNVSAGQSLEHPEAMPADMEKKQSIWWFLLVAGLAALLVEALLSNRQSRRIRTA